MIIIPKKPQARGFALIVTLSLMILLTVIAVGLLTLSSITVRSTGQGNAMSVARANARMALLLAIGELQRTAGPDKAVTAPSEIVAASPAKPNLTGVWDSWDFDVKATSLDYDSPKTQSAAGTSRGFKGWLVSDGSLAGPKDRSYANTAFNGDTVELVGDGALGKGAATFDKVRAGKVRVTRDGKRTGNFAWHVSDESVKARINTYRDLSGTQTLSQKRALSAGHRPDVAVMENSKKTKLGFLPDDVQDYSKALATTGKIINLNQAELFDNTPTIKTFRNDVTPYSLGLLTNVREGGLKQDLTSLFELTTNGASGTTGLPTVFNNKKLYQTNVYSGGAAVTGVSDPYWNSLAGYYNSYKELLTPETTPTLYKIPPEEVALAATVTQPVQFSPAPVIAKVELMFSMLARDKHGPWKGNPGDYEAHMLYIPIFTLHNPYNVSLKFDRMKIGMADVPVGFIFYVNGVAQSGLTPLSDMFVGTKGKKEFWIEIADWPSATATTPTTQITMKPGQTMIFGPYINATEPFMDNNASYFDWANNKTGSFDTPLKSKRGFTGGTYGYDVDWLKGSMLNMNKNDQIAVEFKCASTSATGTPPPFKVSAYITSKGVTKACGGLNFNYGGQSVLDKISPALQRFPKTGGIKASDMYLGNLENPAGSLKAQSFALFSAYARTANGGVDGTGSRTPAAAGTTAFPDGRLAGNPFLHNNAARVAISSDLSKEKPATQSHELNLLKLDGTADNVISYSSDFRTNYLLNYKQVNGRSIKSGSYLEIPSGPLQAIADFRRSNALASPYLPAFVQPVGNSYVSPLMDTNSVIQNGPAGYQLLDQSVLANHALYDRTYFSTLAPVGNTTAVAAFTDFVKDNKPLRSQLFQAYLPAGKTEDNAKNDLFASSGKPAPSAYKLAAQYQMVKGPFNVNSTRVQAWKAMLSSMNHSNLMTLWAKSGVLASTPSSTIPIPAMTLHNGSATTGTFSVANMDDQICNQWNGYREFSEADIEKLATEIVRQVRLRGPFLSMSEFVNRRIGQDSALTRTGALQNAIDDSKLNDGTFTTQVPVATNHVSDANVYGFKTPIAATGNPAAGAPGWLSQADILKLLEPAATVRSDTFVIRTCGEATDSAGNVTARAYAEAVLQRIPEYVNPSDPAAARIPNTNAPSVAADTLTPTLAAPENLAFGRRFEMVSFKWLSANEI